MAHKRKNPRLRLTLVVTGEIRLKSTARLHIPNQDRFGFSGIILHRGDNNDYLIWASDIGHWALDIGHWALGIGHWALDKQGISGGKKMKVVVTVVHIKGNRITAQKRYQESVPKQIELVNSTPDFFHLLDEDTIND
jgi:hypothetical protein